MPNELTPQLKALLLKALENKVAELIAANKKHPDIAGMAPGRTDRVVVDGDVVGSVAMTLGRESIRVADPDAYVEWCDRHHPSEVQVTTSVRQVFTNSLLVVGGQVVDKDGVVVDGVIAVQGDPYPSIKPDRVMAPLLWDAVRANVAELVTGNE